MSNIIVNAPIQNKEFSPDVKVGKAVGLFVADWLRSTDERYAGQRALDLWNNVLASEQYGHDTATYGELCISRLKQKYDSSLLQSIRSNPDDISVLTDTDHHFEEWALGVIERAIDHGDINEVAIPVHVCASCDTAISVAEGPRPRQCAHCPTGSSFRLSVRNTLVTNLDADVHHMVGDVIDSPAVPPKNSRISIVNRRRLSGISLDSLGYEGEVVDPRVGLGLLALYAAAAQGADHVDIVTSRATAGQNLPQFFAATRSLKDELPQLGIRQIVKAPANHLNYLQSEGLLPPQRFSAIMKYILPPILLSMRHDMSPQTLEQIVFSKKKRYTVANS